MTTSGGLGEAEVGGPTLQHRAEDRRQHRAGHRSTSSNVTKGMVGSNYTQELKTRGLSTPGKLFKLWDYQHRHRRSDRERPDLVLRPVPRERQSSHDSRHVRQRQRRRPGQVHLPEGREPSGRRGWKLAKRLAPPDDAGDAPQQVQHLLGRAASVQGRRLPGLRRRLPAVGSERSHLRRARRLQSAVQRHQFARNRHLHQPLWPASAAGDVDVDGEQQAPPRSRPRHLPEPLGRLGDAGKSDERSRPCRRAVCARLPGQRRHCRPHLSFGQLGPELAGHARLARVGQLRHRRP